MLLCFPRFLESGKSLKSCKAVMSLLSPFSVVDLKSSSYHGCSRKGETLACGREGRVLIFYLLPLDRGKLMCYQPSTEMYRWPLRRRDQVETDNNSYLGLLGAEQEGPGPSISNDQVESRS